LPSLRRSGYFTDRKGWKEQRTAIIRGVLAGDIEARERLYEMYSYIADQFADRFSKLVGRFGVSKKELSQVAHLALQEAVTNWSAKNPRTLVPCLRGRVDDGIRRYISEQLEALVNSPHAMPALRKLREFLDEAIEQGIGPPEKIQQADVFLQELTEKAERHFVWENLAQKNPFEIVLGEEDPAEQVDVDALRSVFSEVLFTLTPREQRILILRFGLEGGGTRSLVEVAKEFNVTKERIRQIESRALRKLRHPSRSRHLKDYV